MLLFIEIPIILFLIVSFGFWVFHLQRVWKALCRESQALSAVTDINFLLEESRSKARGKRGIAKRDDVYREFCKKQDVCSEAYVIKHLKLIYEAGWADTRLDIGELNKHTTGQLFRHNGIFRPILGVFIIIGLLGTLVGLINGLNSLSAMEISAGEKIFSSNFQVFMTTVQFAFLPSALGIFFTIVGVFGYTNYLRKICLPLKSTLESTTFNIWVPQLFKTPSEHALKTLSEAQNQLEENMEVAQRVANFTESIDDELKHFRPNIQQANQSIESFNESVRLVEKSSKVFEQTISEISTFQRTLEAMFQQTQENTTEIRKLFSNLSQQNESLEKRLDGLLEFEKAYKEDQRRSRSATEKLLTSAENAFNQLGQRNSEIIEEIGGPINATLKEVERDMRNLEPPIKHSVEMIDGIASTFSNRSEVLIRDLRGEFAHQNAAKEAETKGIKVLNESLNGLVEHLGSMITQQGVVTSKLNQISAPISFSPFHRTIHILTGVGLVGVIYLVYSVFNSQF